MVTTDDVAKVVLDRLEAVTSASTIVPGDFWYDRGPDAPAGYPYVVFKVEVGKPEYTSGDFVLHPFTVRLGGYCPISVSGASTQNVEKLFRDALTTVTANTALRAVSLRNTGEGVISGKEAAAKG